MQHHLLSGSWKRGASIEGSAKSGRCVAAWGPSQKRTRGNLGWRASYHRRTEASSGNPSKSLKVLSGPTVLTPPPARTRLPLIVIVASYDDWGYSSSHCSPALCPSPARLPIRPTPWPLSNRASGPTNRSAETSSSSVETLATKPVFDDLPIPDPLLLLPGSRGWSFSPLPTEPEEPGISLAPPARPMVACRPISV
jgi:hypothetical protein